MHIDQLVPSVQYVAPEEVTDTWRVGQSSDDCVRALFGDYWNLTANMVCAGYMSSSIYQAGCGMRFTDVTIPQAATIVAAYLRFRAFQAGIRLTCNTRISAEDVDNAITFADDRDAFDTRWAARTTARVDWDNIIPWPAGTALNSPEIKAVIQEIVNRGGWASGNSIALFWEDFEDRSVPVYFPPKRYADSYDRTPSVAPLLTVTYIV